MGYRAVRQMDVKSGADAGDILSAAIPFDWTTRMITAECWDNNFEIQLSNDGTTFSDPFEIDVDRPLVIPFAAASLKVKNTTVGSASRYQSGGLE